MSKAFTSESDDEDTWIPPPALPPGTRNYMTPAGAKKFSDEQDQLTRERGRLHGSDFDQNRRRKAIDRRLEFLNGRMEIAEVIDPGTQSPDCIRFGAEVTLQSSEPNEETWRIVGIDEMDLDRNWISWMSPLAAGLFEKKVGDRVVFQGRTFTIVKIRYV